MFCPKCGEDNPDDARFCGACGATYETVRTETPSESVTKVVTSQAGSEIVSNALKYGILGGSLLLPIIGIIMGLIYIFGEGSEDKKAVGKLWLFAGIGLAVLYMIISGSG